MNFAYSSVVTIEEGASTCSMQQTIQQEAHDIMEHGKFALILNLQIPLLQGKLQLETHDNLNRSHCQADLLQKRWICYSIFTTITKHSGSMGYGFS